jgi:hypothetical protein
MSVGEIMLTPGMIKNLQCSVDMETCCLPLWQLVYCMAIGPAAQGFTLLVALNVLKQNFSTDCCKKVT